MQRIQRRSAAWVTVFCLIALRAAGRDMETEMNLVDVRMIWDEARHNAFTDLIRFQSRWYCVFREGSGHVSDDGQLRVIRSDDGDAWSSVASMTWENGDVREAKFSVTPAGELMLTGAVRLLNTGKTHIDQLVQSVTWFSKDGENWSEAYACPSGRGTWRWRTTWHDSVAYSFGYSRASGKDPAGCLYRSTDGKTWSVLRNNVYPSAKMYGNETALLFLEDDTACCLLRRDSANQNALFGTAQPPYTDWTWKELDARIGGPAMIRFEDGGFLAGVRLYDGRQRTALCRIDPAAGTITEALTLPSGGDTSYAGLVMHHGVLWVSYYSRHEGPARIYLARVQW